MDETEKKEPSKKETAMGCLVLIVIVAALVFLFQGCFGDDKTNNTSQTVDVKSMPMETYAQYLVKETVGERNNNDKLVFRQIVGTEGLYTIELNASDNLTTKLFKASMLGDSIDIYKKAFADRPDLRGLKVDWYTTLVDQKGNESEGSVLWVIIKNENAKTINWDNVLTDNLPKIADGYWEHPLFSRE